MAATTIGTTGLLWGITAEAGVLIQSYERKIQRDKKEIKNESGEVSALSYYNSRATYSFDAYVTGNTGVGAAAPGVAISFANSTSGNGVIAGTVYVDEVTVSQANEDFKKISGSATQYPLI